MYTANQNAKLIKAVDLMEQADALIQQALGSSDRCYEICTQLQNAIEELLEEVQEGNTL